jgi:protein-disulfide isomerase
MSIATSSWEPTLAKPIDPGRDHVRGNADAPVVLVQYGDYECPFCRAAHPVIEDVRRQEGDNLAFVYRHFPIMTVHPHAEQAAEAAEAAGDQGAFWKMHDRLYTGDEGLDSAHLIARARALDLDIDRFVGDLDGRRFAPRIQEDLLSGLRSGVQGTPTFFVNGIRYDGPADLHGLLAAVTQVRG